MRRTRSSTRGGAVTRPTAWRTARAGLVIHAAIAPAPMSAARLEIRVSSINFPPNPLTVQCTARVTFNAVPADRRRMAEAAIRDVARHAQLSVATVSRALNGLENVSERARERIAAAVKDLGYVPHAGARSLSLARSNAIGVVLPDLHGEFFSEFVRGMDREASSKGYLLLLSNLHAGSEQSTSALRAMRGRVDGLVVMAPHLEEHELARALPEGIPALLVNTR